MKWTAQEDKDKHIQKAETILFTIGKENDPQACKKLARELEIEVHHIFDESQYEEARRIQEGRL